MREPELKSIDPVLCISVSAREWLEAGFERRDRAVAPDGDGDGDGGGDGDGELSNIDNNMEKLKLSDN